MVNNIIFEFDNGAEKLIMDGGDWWISDYDGILSAQNQINMTENIGIYGSRVTSRKMPYRDISVDFARYGRKNRAEARETAIRFFSVISGILTVTYLDRARSINYEVCSLVQSSKNVWDEFSAHLEITCPDPIFRSPKIESKQISTWVGGWKWPFSFPFRMRSRGEPRIVIINNGHIDAPVEIEFHGPASEPVVRNVTTGEQIHIKGDVTEDEILYINTEKNTVEIEKNGICSDAMQRFDYFTSTFFRLQAGDNVIEYETENESVPQRVVINYQERYLGV